MMWKNLVLACLVVLTSAGPPQDPEQVLGLFEGDIVLPPQTGFRSAINQKQKLWPNGKVPYQIHDPESLITADQLANLTLAMTLIEARTCIRFQKTDDPTINSFLRFQKSRSGCSSNVGMIQYFAELGVQGQTIRLSDHCFAIGKITHEIMHSLGFFHEQSRHDRDQYVRIIPENIDQGKTDQFRHYNLDQQDTKLGAPYDYGSLMHYPTWAFSQGEDLPTIVPTYQAEIGQREGMSEIDVWKINKLYNCPNLGPVPTVKYVKKDMEDVEMGKNRSTFKCDFDFMWSCSMHDEMGSSFDWQIGQGQTSKYFETGPKKSANGEDCCYVYIDSIAKRPGSQSTLVTPRLLPQIKHAEEGSCFTFYYHMFGNTVGSLEVFWRNVGSSEEHVLLKENGSQGDRWIKKNFILYNDSEYEIVFRATTGGDENSYYEGNIAVDDINIRPMFRLTYKGETCD